jgi:gliding motility-associated-like protein
MSNPGSLNPVVTPTQTTAYTLTATQNGCTLTDQATITIETGVTIPNSFSPNGDGTNDTWIIEGAELFPDASIAIYSRWGTEVFRSRGYNALKAWKGTDDKGEPLADGVYFYVYELNDADKQLFKGSVTLIR